MHNYFCYMKEGIDLANFSVFSNEEDTENDAFKEDEVELSKKNTITLSVSTDEASEFWIYNELLYSVKQYVWTKSKY